MVLIEPSIGTLISQFCTGRRFDGRRLQIGKPETSCFRRHFKSPAEDAPVWDCLAWTALGSGHATVVLGPPLLNDEHPLKSSMHRISFR
jgi:hypothetical protein